MNTLKTIVLILLIFSLAYGLSAPVDVSPNLVYQRTIDLSRTDIKNPDKFVVDGAYIYITDRNDAVVKCDMEGDVVTRITQAGTDKLYPVALAKDFQYLYVLDQLRGIVKFTLDYDFYQFYWISPNMRNDEISEVRALAMDTVKDLYIADAGQNALIKINTLGLREWQYGGFGTGPSALQDPIALAVDGISRIYVVDRQLARVNIYDQDQTLVGTLKEFKEPVDIAIRPGNPATVFVGDRGSQTVEIFQNDMHIQTLVVAGVPRAIACTATHIYVLDAQQKRMYVYGL